MAPELEDPDQINVPRLQQEFTGRKSLIAAFEKLLRLPCPVPVLAYFGIGGSGKTWLLNYLRQISGPPRPSALVNFRPGHTGTSAQEALWSIRSQLGQQGKHLSFRRFDLVWGILWQKQYQVSIRQNRALLPEEIEQIAGILETSEDMPGLGRIVRVLNLLYKNFRRTREWQHRKKVSSWVYRTLGVKPPEGLKSTFDTGTRALSAETNARLEALLPIALADDLADVAASRPLPAERILIFIDTYEFLEDGFHAIFGPDKVTYIQVFSERIERAEANILIAIASKNPIRWAETRLRDGHFVVKKDSFWAADITVDTPEVRQGRHLWQYRVDTFSEPEVEEYLRDKHGVRNIALIHELLKVTAGYPLALATGVQLLREDSVGLSNDLVNLRARLSSLKTFSPAWRDELCAFFLERIFEQLKKRGRYDLISLMGVASIPRWFDTGLLSMMTSRAYDIRSQISDLAGHPFVELYGKRGSRKLPTYSVHSAVRKLILETLGGIEERAALHEKVRFYCQQAKKNCENPEDAFAFELEKIYHSAEVSRSSGVNLGEECFARELERTRFDRCESILETLRDVEGWPQENEAQILCLTARLRMVLGEYDSALQIFKAANELEPLTKGFAPFRAKIVYYEVECLRLAGKYPEALRKCEELRAAGNRFNSKFITNLADWRALLIYKLLDDVPAALHICSRLVGLSGAEIEAEAAAFGVSSPQVRLANIHRQEAELKRYVGDYVGSGRAIDLCFSIYPPGTLEYAYTHLCSAHLLSMEGKWDRALIAADQATAVFSRISVPHIRGMLSVSRVRGFAVYGMGNTELAGQYFQELLECSPRLYPYGPIYGHLGCGEVARMNDRLDDAKFHYSKAVEFCNELRGRIEQGYSMLGMAEIARRERKYDEAVDAILKARHIGRGCGYPWLEFYSNLIGALSSSNDRRDSFLAASVEVVRRFKRRDGDSNLEDKIYQQIVADIASHQPTLPLRFQFP